MQKEADNRELPVADLLPLLEKLEIVEKEELVRNPSGWLQGILPLLVPGCVFLPMAPIETPAPVGSP